MTVVLDSVSKSFGDVEVLRALDVSAEDGEFLVLLGASGSGKSTALRMIAGLESTSSGRVIIGERDVTNVLPKNRDVAMVFQSYALYPHKTVAENIGYPLSVRGESKESIAKQVADVAAQVQLEEYLDRYPRQLSGGQRQRVALARAMVRRPTVFLMDEPLSNLDAKLRGHMRTELKRMQHDLGITTIYVTHDQVEAMTLADRVAILEQGVLQQLGTPREIYDDPVNLFVAGFIGSPPMNQLSGRADGGQFHHASGVINTSIDGSLDTATLGIRPEDCSIVSEAEASLVGRLYATELIGDHVLATVALDASEDTLTIKMPKDFEGQLDDRVGVTLAAGKHYLFDAQGERLR